MRFFLFLFSAITALGQSIPATFAGAGGRGKGDLQLVFPGGVAFDSQDNLYIADVYNHRIQKVTPDGFLNSIVGTGENQFHFPRTIALDKAGNLYVADSYAHRIQKVAPDGSMSIIAGRGGQGNGLTQLSYPRGVAVDSNGNVFIADNYNHRVLRVTAEGIITVVAGGGGQGTGPAQLNFPSGIAVDSQDAVYITDSYNHRVQKVTAAGVVTTVAGAGGVGVGETQLVNPVGVDVDGAGNIYVSDCGNHRIQKITPDGLIQTIAGGNGDGPGERQLSQPFDSAVDSAGNLYIADTYNHRVQKLTFPAPFSAPQTWHSATNRASAGAPNLLMRLSPQVACPSAPEVNVGGYPAESIPVAGGLLFVVPELVDPGGVTEVYVTCETRSLLPVINLPMVAAQPKLFASWNGQALASPVKSADLIAVYGSGFGLLEPIDPLGRRRVMGMVTATIGGITADVLYAGSAPGQSVGVEQINLRVPSGLTPGAQPVIVAVDGVNTQGNVFVVVQ